MKKKFYGFRLNFLTKTSLDYKYHSIIIFHKFHDTVWSKKRQDN